MASREPKSLKGKSTSSVKLSRDDWVDAGLAAITRHGIEGVRVEPIAKALKVTKGSFYWHFKDREELCDAILERWRRQNTIEIIDYLSDVTDARERLRRLIRMPFETSTLVDPMRLSLGLLLWARNEPRVERVLAEIDELRVRMIAQMLIAIGIPESEAMARSVLTYSYMHVAMTLVESSDRVLQDQCEAILFGGSPAGVKTSC